MSDKAKRITFAALVLLGLCAMLSAVAFADAPASQPTIPATQPATQPSVSVTVPPGLYRPVSPLVFTGLSNITLNCDGVVIKAGDTQATTADVSDSIRLVNCKGVTIRNLTIDGNASTRGNVAKDGSQASIGVWGSSNITLEGCTFSGAVCDDVFVCASGNFPVADPSAASKFVTITSCTFTGPAYRQQISIVHGQHVVIAGNKFNGQTSNFTGTAIDVEANPGDADGVLADVLITGNDFAGCTLGASVIGTANPKGVTITGNRFAAGTRGVFSGAPGTVVSGNTFTGLTGIGITNNAPARIVGNTLSDCGDTGIYFNPGSGASLVAGNTLTDVGQPAGTKSPWVVQTRFGGGGEILIGNTVSFKTPRPDLTPYLVEAGSAVLVGNR